MKPMVSTIVAMVIQVCSRMITSKPRTPAADDQGRGDEEAEHLGGVAAAPAELLEHGGGAPATPASTSTVSQPTSSTQERNVGSALPCTPNAARLSTIVGADPRLPASATTPHSANDRTIPTTAAIVACQNETPKPTMNEP